MNLAQITTHIEDALKRLMQQYKGKANIEALITMKAEHIQAMENVIYSLLDRLDIDACSGTQLDGIGKVVNQPREGITDDALYRIALKAKIGENSSQGTPEQIIAIWNLLSNSTETQLTEVFPAEIQLMSNNRMDDELIELAYELIQNAAPAGVNVNIIGYYDPEGAFAYDGNDPTGNNKGYGSLTDPDIGGSYAGFYDI